MWSFIVEVWNTLIFEPLLNLIGIIQAVLPGHNFGLTLIIFTIIIRFLLYPVIKKQLQQARKQRELQPEIAKIKKQYKGNRQQETMATLALYKEKGFNPFAMLFYLFLQFPLLLALYQIIKNIATDVQAVFNEHTYGFVQDLPWMKELLATSEPAAFFDSTLLGSADLTQAALSTNAEGQTVFVLGAFLILVATVFVQFLTSKQMMSMTHPGKKPKKLRQLLKAQAAGEEVDQTEISAAANRFLIYIIPALIFLLGLGWFAALPFYWLVNGLIQYWQHQRFNSQADAALAGANVNGRPTDGEVRLNAKQKKEASRQRAGTSAGGRKRVQATVKTKASKPAKTRKKTKR